MKETTWFRKEITIGTLIQLVTMLVLASGAYFKFDARVSRAEERAAISERRLETFENSVRELTATSVRLTTVVESLERRPTPPFRPKG